MKKLRTIGWNGLLPTPRTRPCRLQPHHRLQLQQHETFASTRHRPQSASAVFDETYEPTEEDDSIPQAPISTSRKLKAPSPPPEAARRSAKLASLKARLSLPAKLPLETLARTLVDHSADPNPAFNNASLAQIGASLLSYHVSEYLLCTYPRLPMAILFSAVRAYAGPPTLQKIGTEWGIEAASDPGSEVEPGYLQFSRVKPGEIVQLGAAVRGDKKGYRRGMSSRVVYDDEFGDLVHRTNSDVAERAQYKQDAMARFVRALVGTIYMHGGRKTADSFIKAHVLSRHLDVSRLFEFKSAVRDLSRLCAREDFEPPTARILSETGRMSRAPVFVVGIFSGQDKLGEGVGPSLHEARYRAAVAGLKAWYLYNPDTAMMPSEMEGEAGAKGRPFEPVHIDLGEIIS